jgi:hypothetical protein
MTTFADVMETGWNEDAHSRRFLVPRAASMFAAVNAVKGELRSRKYRYVVNGEEWEPSQFNVRPGIEGGSWHVEAIYFSPALISQLTAVVP